MATSDIESQKAYRRRLMPSLACRTGLFLCALLGAGLLVGCNPQALSMLLMPWVDNREPAKCKIADSKKEVTLAIVTWFGNPTLETYPDLMPADGQLAEQLGAMLNGRYQLNKEKVKIVPAAQVRAAQTKAFGGTISPVEVGAKVKADKVIALEIRSLSLRIKGSSSFQNLYRGTIDLDVKVYDLDKTEDRVIFEQPYSFANPRECPATEDFTSVDQFRQLFLNRVSRDLSRLFAAYPNDERMHSMDTD